MFVHLAVPYRNGKRRATYAVAAVAILAFLGWQRPCMLVTVPLIFVGVLMTGHAASPYLPFMIALFVAHFRTVCSDQVCSFCESVYDIGQRAAIPAKRCYRQRQARLATESAAAEKSRSRAADPAVRRWEVPESEHASPKARSPKALPMLLGKTTAGQSKNQTLDKLCSEADLTA
eukprot:gnl/TRDRNA2_/TRDRNA2_93026_c0_seq1.p1 gnl/TRDRNA2_/TRDRNA2_93026_c0~~gnl/TRDRNA2_/TRDRNA2_93026_c0_seq1.p1  ORF type:complete len:175 (+),score=13.45 gnl/TRDRNA2_/TRDRNA2_93026_c0_seq1:50-574(+)